MLTSEANDSPEGGQEVIAGTRSPSNVMEITQTKDAYE